MYKHKHFLLIISIASIFFLSGFHFPFGYSFSNLIDNQDRTTTGLRISYFDFYQFIRDLPETTSEKSIVGLYAIDSFSFPVIQQPAQQPGFVSNQDGVLTQFSLVKGKNAHGLLAHNHLAGSEFSSLKVNDILVAIDGKNEHHFYQIEAIEEYQATLPTSPYSNFIDLRDPDKVLSSTQLFNHIYTMDNVLILQTCIAKGDELSWGRLFIIAKEKTDLQLEDLLDFSDQTVLVTN